MDVRPDGTGYPTNTGQNPMDLDEQLILTDKITVPSLFVPDHKSKDEEDLYERSPIECDDTATLPRR